MDQRCALVPETNAVNLTDQLRMVADSAPRLRKILGLHKTEARRRNPHDNVADRNTSLVFAVATVDAKPLWAALYHSLNLMHAEGYEY